MSVRADPRAAGARHRPDTGMPTVDGTTLAVGLRALEAVAAADDVIEARERRLVGTLTVPTVSRSQAVPVYPSPRRQGWVDTRDTRCLRRRCVKMNYIEIETDQRAHGKPSLVERVIRKFIPAANPDIEGLIEKTRYWWLEYDELGAPQREIGFDENKEPVVLAPVGENTGFLVDSSDNWLNYKEQSKEAAEGFESTWQSLWPKFKHLERDS